MIVFLFGLPGVGKTYIGQLMQQRLGAFFWDGDEALTREMRETVSREEAFSEAMTQALTSTLIHKIKDLQAENDFIVVSQAMLRESDRQFFRQCFDDIQFLYISCGHEQLNERIAKRADMVSVSYLEKLISAFEPYRGQAESYPDVHNDNKTDEQLINEIREQLAIPLSHGCWSFFSHYPKILIADIKELKSCLPSI